MRAAARAAAPARWGSTRADDAVRLPLRGADTLCVAVVLRFGAVLVILDHEQLTRATAVVPVLKIREGR
jgi:hypothetical protein